MKTTVAPQGRTGKTTTPANAAPPVSRRTWKRIAVKLPTPETNSVATPVALLPERFSAPDKTCVCLGLYAPEARAVFVAGSFNGWHPSALPLQKQTSGRWVVELVLEPGRYEYRFVVDGELTDDPLSQAYARIPSAA